MTEEVKVERDTALEQCQKYKQLVEEIKAAKEVEDPIGPVDEMSSE